MTGTEGRYHIENLEYHGKAACTNQLAAAPLSLLLAPLSCSCRQSWVLCADVGSRLASGQMAAGRWSLVTGRWLLAALPGRCHLVVVHRLRLILRLTVLPSFSRRLVPCLLSPVLSASHCFFQSHSFALPLLSRYIVRCCLVSSASFPLIDPLYLLPLSVSILALCSFLVPSYLSAPFFWRSSSARCCSVIWRHPITFTLSHTSSLLHPLYLTHSFASFLFVTDHGQTVPRLYSKLFLPRPVIAGYVRLWLSSYRLALLGAHGYGLCPLMRSALHFYIIHTSLLSIPPVTSCYLLFLFFVLIPSYLPAMLKGLLPSLRDVRDPPPKPRFICSLAHYTLPLLAILPSMCMPLLDIIGHYILACASVSLCPCALVSSCRFLLLPCPALPCPCFVGHPLQ